MAQLDLGRDTVTVARELVGCFLHCGQCCGRIVETEAYLGQQDPASHAFRGPTPRSAIMFGPVGKAYVYLSYGVHYCLNVVAHPPGQAGAVLIRALEPLKGIEEMIARRKRRDHLTDGPGKLCQALAIDDGYNGVDLLDGSSLRLEPSWAPDEFVACGPRVGISVATEREYRFWLEKNPQVSQWRPGPKRQPRSTKKP